MPPSQFPHIRGNLGDDLARCENFSEIPWRFVGLKADKLLVTPA